MAMQRESYVIFDNWTEAINKLPEEFQLETYKALMQFARSGEMPDAVSAVTSAMLTSFSVGMENAIARYAASVENGKKGGRPQKTQENPRKPGKNPNANGNAYENGYENENGQEHAKSLAPQACEPYGSLINENNKNHVRAPVENIYFTEDERGHAVWRLYDQVDLDSLCQMAKLVKRENAVEVAETLLHTVVGIYLEEGNGLQKTIDALTPKTFGTLFERMYEPKSRKPKDVKNRRAYVTAILKEWELNGFE